MSIARQRVVAVALFCVALAAPAARADDRGAALFELCTQCHGSAGEGNQQFGAPAIAGLPFWFVQGQVLKFQKGLRGTHFDDLEGMRMRPMALTLRKTEDVDAVAAHVASLPAMTPAPTLEGGDAAAGSAGYAVCASCHGQRGEGSQEQSAPPLAGMSDWYLLSSLQKFKDGVRGGNMQDMNAVMMRPMAMGIVDQKAMKDIIAYIGTFSK